jgi:hypothetical protein
MTIFHFSLGSSISRVTMLQDEIRFADKATTDRIPHDLQNMVLALTSHIIYTCTHVLCAQSAPGHAHTKQWCDSAFSRVKCTVRGLKDNQSLSFFFINLILF